MLLNFGIEIFPQDNVMKDGTPTPAEYVNLSGERNNVILSDNLFDPIRSTIADINDPVVYHGVGARLDSENDYVFPILSASESTYNSDDKAKLFGSDITLAAGY